MLSLSDEEFEDLVAAGIDSLHPEMLAELDNVIFLIEEFAPNYSDILGSYEGFSLTERSNYGYGEEPDKIILYRKSLLSHCDSIEDLIHEIRVTLVHEVAHYFGMTEERIHELGWG